MDKEAQGLAVAREVMEGDALLLPPPPAVNVVERDGLPLALGDGETVRLPLTEARALAVGSAGEAERRGDRLGLPDTEGLREAEVQALAEGGWVPLALPLRADVEEAVTATQGVLVRERVPLPPGLPLPQVVEEALPVSAPVSVPPPPRLAVPDTLNDPVPAAVRLCVRDRLGVLQAVPEGLALALALGQRLGEVEGDAHGVAVALAHCDPCWLGVGGLSLGEAVALPHWGLGVTVPEGHAVELVEEEGHVELEADTVPLTLPMGDRDTLAVVLGLAEALGCAEGVMDSDALRVGQGEAQGEEVEEEECDCEPVVLPVREAVEGCETVARSEVEGAAEGVTVVQGERVAASTEGEVLGDQVSEGRGEGVPGRDALASPLALLL